MASGSSEIRSKVLDNWSKFLISYFSEGRLPEPAVKEADNVVLDYNGVIRPRGCFLKSGVPDLPAGLEPLGNDFPFRRGDGSSGLINMFVDSDGKANLYTLNTDMQGWKKHDIEYDAKNVPSMEQVADVVVVGNGVDKFSYYDIKQDRVVQLVKVPDPTTAPKSTPVGFSGDPAMDYYYKIAFAGAGGSTKMSPSTKVSSEKIRENWSAAQQVTIDITSVPVNEGAKTWSIYIAAVATGSGVPTDSEYLTLVDGLDIDQKTHTDTGGSLVLKSAPIENTTEGPIADMFKNISGRLWAIRRKTSTVYWGGDIGHELYFGSSNGSDSKQISSDASETPMSLVLGRDNSGTTCINLITQTMSGHGAIWDIYATTNSVTANQQTFSVGTYQFKKREGNDGTDAPFSAIHANNNAHYMSTEGVKSTGVKPNISGIQSTDIISSAIRDRVLNLSEDSLKRCFAAYYDQTLYWTVAYASEKNNEIWTYDILHGGVWSIWKVRADGILRWSSAPGEPPSLWIRQGKRLLRYYRNATYHADDGVPFRSYIRSGLIPMGKDFVTWVTLLKQIWFIDRLSGTIALTVNLHSKSGDIVKTRSITSRGGSVDTGAVVGWGARRRDRGGYGSRSFGEPVGTQSSSAQFRDAKISQNIRKNVSYVSFSLESDKRNTYYELSRISMLYTVIGNGMEFLNQRGVYKI